MDSSIHTSIKYCVLLCYSWKRPVKKLIQRPAGNLGFWFDLPIIAPAITTGISYPEHPKDVVTIIKTAKLEFGLGLWGIDVDPILQLAQSVNHSKKSTYDLENTVPAHDSSGQDGRCMAPHYRGQRHSHGTADILPQMLDVSQLYQASSWTSSTSTHSTSMGVWASSIKRAWFTVRLTWTAAVAPIPAIAGGGSMRCRMGLV